MPFSGISWINPEISQSMVLGNFLCFPYGLRDMGMGMIGLRLLTLNEYECGITNILTLGTYITVGGV